MRSVGIIGLGIMGGAFAKNLAAEGWQVMGYDIDAGRARTLARAGVEIAADVGELASRAPTIMLAGSLIKFNSPECARRYAGL